MEFVGTIELNNTVDITDPCYDKDTWCRMTTKCAKGTYYGYAEISDEGRFGKRVASISIYKDNKVDEIDFNEIGQIGVDAGMAGFFNNKKDYNDEEWDEFISKLEHKKNRYWNFDEGIFSKSGYGDGQYDVLANKDRTAFKIIFI